MARTFVGVSGFSYTGWRGAFYPEDLKNEDFLTFYSKRLGSVEINSSFYAPPRASVLKGWSVKTGRDFKFSFKAPRRITHISKLGKESSEAAKNFSASVSTMGSKRGPILFQLPPYVKSDPNRLETFLSETKEIAERVFEFRDVSWFQRSTYDLLEKEGAALCVAETDETKPEVRAIGNLAYFRLRQSRYSESDVDEWSKTIRQNTGSSNDCYVYLRHDESGENAVLAQKLSVQLSA